MVAIRILLADDHTVVRRMLRALIDEEEGCEVCGEAVDGEEAVQLAHELRPDIAVLAISMPRLSGLETAQRIRALRLAPEVLIVSLHDTEQFVGLALQAGAKGYLLKSDAPEHLLPAIRKIAMEHQPYFTMLFKPAMGAAHAGRLAV